MSKMRDAKRKSYLKMAENNIDKFSREISMPPHEFAQNLKVQNCVNKVPRRSEKPSELAKKYICETYSNVLEVLVLACTLIGDEMAAHPSIRKFVRDRYMQGLRISTEPTEKGESELDCFHPDYKIKRLKIVPIDKFKDDTWLRIQRAKERGLIEIIYEHERILIDTIDFMKNYYLESDPTDRNEKEWRTFYNEIIERVVLKLLLPDLEKRADQELREKAIEFVISKVKENFMKEYLMIPPYLFQKKACHMISIIYENTGKPVLTAVHVNEFGDYRNHHAFSYLLLPYAEKNAPESYDADLKKLRDFIWESKVGLIIVPANGPEAKNLKKLIKEKIIDDSSTIAQMGHEPWISYGKMNVPYMATQSPNYDQDLKNYPIEVKQGVSLARFKQSPLNETLRLWSEMEGENMQILNLHFHEFQDAIPKSRMIDLLRNTAVLAVNNIGVDLYHTVMNNNLQF